MNIIIIVFGVLAAFCMGYYVFAASYAGLGSAFVFLAASGNWICGNHGDSNPA